MIIILMKRIYYTHAMHKHIFPKLRFFFRIKRQTRTHSKKSTVTICVLDGSERVCVCLTHTQHVHIMYTISAQKYVFVCLFAHCVNLRSVTTHVSVVYMFDKHVHALKSLVISIFTGVFTERVRVWRLILKKSHSQLFPSPYFPLCTSTRTLLM